MTSGIPERPPIEELLRKLFKKRPPSTIADGKGGRVRVWPCVMCGDWIKTQLPGWCSEQCRHALEVRDALTDDTGKWTVVEFSQDCQFKGKRYSARTTYRLLTGDAEEAIRMGFARRNE